MPKKKLLNGYLGEISSLQDCAHTDDFSEINHRLGTTTQMRTRTKHPEKRPKEKKEKAKTMGMKAERTVRGH